MTPEQEEQVRRALASAPPAGELPPEVAARLDATLAGLVAERAAADTDERHDAGPVSAPVAALEERRRRRWPRVLVAAASVSVLAYGVGVALDGLQVSGGSASSTAARDETFAGAGADSAQGGSEAAPEDAPTGLVTDRGAVKEQGARSLADNLLVTRTVRLHRARLEDEVARLLDRATLDEREPAPSYVQGTTGGLARCEQPDLARGDRVAAVRLDGRRGTLVVRKAVEGTHEAEVYSCGDGSRLLAITQVPSSR